MTIPHKIPVIISEETPKEEKQYSFLKDSLIPSVVLGLVSTPIGAGWFSYSYFKNKELPTDGMLISLSTVGALAGLLLNGYVYNNLNTQVFTDKIGGNIQIEERYVKDKNLTDSDEIIKAMTNLPIYKSLLEEKDISKYDFIGTRRITTLDGDNEIKAIQSFERDEKDRIRTSYDNFSKNQSIKFEGILSIYPNSALYDTANGLCKKAFEEDISKQ